jgi:hypothetical protein
VRESLERAWVTFMNSNGFRKFAQQGAGSKVIGTESYKRLLLAKNYVSTYPSSQINNARFEGVKTFCVFIGPTKSGSTMIGSLLDAHPNIVLADELDALRYVAAGFNKHQLYQILLRRSRRHAMVGRITARRLQAYSFEIPGQWQGSQQNLQVIGDSKAGITTRRLAENPGLLERLDQVMAGVAVKLIMVIRNPYDPITAMMIRGKRPFDNAMARYFTNIKYLVALREVIDVSDLEVVRYEDFVYRPKERLNQICHFLGVSAGEDYLNDCAAIIYDSPEKIRHMVSWQTEWIKAVETEIERYDFLQGYSFEN